MKGTDIIEFLVKRNILEDKKASYASFAYNYRLLKDEPYEVRITVGGDCLDYAKDIGFLAANLLETKILINSTILDIDKNVCFMSTNIKNYFLATWIKDLEYMKILCKYILQDIWQKYNLDKLVSQDNKLCIKIQTEIPCSK